MMRKMMLFAAFVLIAAPAAAQQEVSIDTFVELLRGDVRTEKVEILTQALDLTEAQSQAFWPIYRQYDTELSAIGDKRLVLVKQFVATYDVMTDEEAGTFARKWMAIQKERLALREKYFGKIAKATSNKIAARFLQVENTVGMLLDLNLAAEAPLLK